MLFHVLLEDFQAISKTFETPTSLDHPEYREFLNLREITALQSMNDISRQQKLLELPKFYYHYVLLRKILVLATFSNHPNPLMEKYCYADGYVPTTISC